MKNSLITSGVYDLFLDTKKQLYLSNQNCNDLELYLSVIPDKEMLETCSKMYKANRQRKYNNWNEICKWLFVITRVPIYSKYKLIFGTLTFSEKSLENTTERTRARYITKYLSENTFHYIANIDFGEKNNREHYHFIALVEDKLKCESWKYGLSKFQFIKFSRKDIKRAKNYILKLNNHSYKSSTKLKRIIRDRKEDKTMDFITQTLAAEDFHKFKLLLNANE